jgi:hypothetical protein
MPSDSALKVFETVTFIPPEWIIEVLFAVANFNLKHSATE